mgnify:CR=1 FL=1|jgi:hypothetical protein
MSVDVEIYISQFKTFFQENPDDVANLIGKADPDQFFLRVYNQALQNFEQGNDIELTQKQLINIIVELNDKDVKVQDNLEIKIPIMKTQFGDFILN